MFQLYKPIALLTVLLLFSCTKNNEKTEIRFQLYDAPFIYKLTNDSKDSAFLEAFRFAKENFNPSMEEFIDVLSKKLLEQNPECKLASYFGTFELKDKINPDSDNQQVVSVIKDEVKMARATTIEILKKRIMNVYKPKNAISGMFNKVEIEITELPGKNSYLLTLNRKPDKIRITQLLEQQGGIGFWETYKLPEVFEFLNAANTKIRELGLAEIVKEEKKEPANENDDELMNLVQNDSTAEKWAKENPLFRILNLSVDHDGKMKDECNVGISMISDTPLVNKYLALPEISALFPRNLMFLWESRPISFNREFINLIAIRISSRDGVAPLDGNYIVQAEAIESNGMAVISMSMNAEGARIWSRMTKENIDRQIAIVFNHSVYSYPRVMSEIKEGRSEITGNFTPEEASELASIINSGVLPGIGVKVLEIKQ